MFSHFSSVCVFGSSFSAGAKGTGAGLAEWALNAYNSGWSYVYGGSTPGAVDCSGLIYSYAGGERCGNPQLETATETGSVSAGIPNVHGLGLWRPGHVGVYVGNGMEVDARGDEYGVCYEAIGGYNNWTYWFKLAAVSYVTNGWESFNGNYYYYENGEYIVNTSRTIDGTTYYLIHRVDRARLLQHFFKQFIGFKLIKLIRFFKFIRQLIIFKQHTECLQERFIGC